jgi:acetyl-CoA acetyltransferase
MAGGSDLFDGARIVGIYTTEHKRSLWPRTGISLALEALKGALDDAGMSFEELDGISSHVSDWPYGVNALGADTFWARQLGRPMHWRGSGVDVGAIMGGIAAIERGQASTVAIVSGLVRDPNPDKVAPWARPSNEFTEWTGSYTTIQYSLPAQRYVHEFGEGAIEAMAEASAVIRNYGNINPTAIYYGRGPFTAQDVLDSRPIASPLTLLMCSSVNDGGCAVIITSKERAQRAERTANRSVRVLTGGTQWPYPPYYDAPVLDAVPDAGRFAREAMSRAGIVNDDLDVLELYDHFSIGVLMEFEMYGFCGRGEAADFVKSGIMKINGKFPTCTDGGNESYCHNGNPALYRTIEAVRQLRGEVEDHCPEWAKGVHTHAEGVCRAATDPELAFVANPGPPTGGGCFAVLARD